MPSEQVPALAPALVDVQRRFYELVTAPEGVEQGLADAGLSEDDLARMVASDARLSAVDRLNVYANMYFFRIRDVLRDDYPKLVAALGDDGFHNLVVDYLLACPPTDFSIRNAGERLPGFLVQHESSAERPWLADLAGLERQRTDVFDAADAPLLDADRLRALPPEAFENLSVKLIPAHRILEVRFQVLDLWRTLAEGRPPGEPSPQPQAVLIWRREPLVLQRPLTPLEAEVRPLLEAGTSLAALGERLAEHRPLEEVPPLAFALLSQLVHDGLIAATDA
jgi:hypothetical protein